MRTHLNQTAVGNLPAAITDHRDAIALIRSGVSNFDLRDRLEPRDVDRWWGAIHNAYRDAMKADPYGEIAVELRLLRDHVGEMPNKPTPTL